MKRFPLSLRISIPATLLLFSSLLGSISFQREISVSHLRKEEDATLQARFSGDQTSGSLEYLFRKGDEEGANLVISKLGSNTALQNALLVDENNKIILANQYELRQRPLADTEAANYLPQINKVRQLIAGRVTLSADKKTILATYPVVLGSQPGEVRSSRVGVLLLKYDLSESKLRAYNDALQRSLESAFVLGILCLGVWFLFDKTLTSRVERLVKATNKLAQGELSVRSKLGGSDEIAKISVAFDQMAENIYYKQQALEQLAERRELLNNLASQIRNSLELDTVLITTVNEIRNLFQIDCCKFLWCEKSENELCQLKLSHEACNDNDTNYSRHNKIQEIPLLREMILKLGILKIDKVDEDAQIDNVTRFALTSWGFTSLLAIKMHTNTGRTGVILCEHREQPRCWTSDEVELLQEVANQLAIAIDQAELYTQSRNAATIAASQAQELAQALKNLQQTQAQLIQTEKMSSLGQLVAGVAHEINNPVNFIYGNINYVSDYTKDLLTLIELYQQRDCHPNTDIENKIAEIDLDFLAEDLPKIITSMRVGAERIREIVLTLRNFSRLDEAEMKPVNIHEGIDSTLVILQNQLKAKSDQHTIKLIKAYSDLPMIECYAGQLNQVFLNIIKNAIDALHDYNKQKTPEKSAAQPSTITITTQILETNWVSICIKDNGPGIPETVKDKIFDPFFTTKPVGEGTGLGLSISYQIVVDKHKGQFKCISEPGQGTEFWIQIPIEQISSSKAQILQLNSHNLVSTPI